MTKIETKVAAAVAYHERACLAYEIAVAWVKSDLSAIVKLTSDLGVDARLTYEDIE